MAASINHAYKIIIGAHPLLSPSFTYSTAYTLPQGSLLIWPPSLSFTLTLFHTLSPSLLSHSLSLLDHFFKDRT